MIDPKGLALMNATNQLLELQERLAKLEQNHKEAKMGEKKNHKPGKPSAGRKYVLLTKKLSTWGNVPQQQADLADLLAKNFEVGKEYTEAEVFNAVIDGSGEYESLCKSKQDPTYLFRYYRGLKDNGKHAGFIAREFFRVIG